MDASPHQDHGDHFSTLRPSTGQSEETSIRTDDTEGTAIHKTVLKWYEKAKQPSLYRKKSFGSIFVSDMDNSTESTPGSSTAPMIKEKNVEEVIPGEDSHQERGSSRDDGDENAVGWDDPHDPENPLEWPTWKKAINIAVIILICFTS